ncbi:MAG: SMC family ATPase [Chloroflexi bacterium]|nr:SMC family ATPase [Chloroflexota bacterium]
MLPIRLEIKNFLAYRSPEPLYFEGIHLACLSGPNGAGKSTLLDAITWALWGKARARRDEELIHQGQNDMYVLLQFEQAGVMYEVVRTRARTRTAGGLAFYSMDGDGTRVDLSEGSMRATQALIEKTINLDYETFAHSAFLRQGNADAFTIKTPKERKQILSDILGLNRWESFETRAKAVIAEIDVEVAAAEGQIREIDAMISREPEMKRHLQAAQEALIAATERAEAARQSYDELRDVESNRRHTEDRLEDAKNRLRSAEIKVGQAAGRVQIRKQRVDDYLGLLDRRDEIETGYQALQEARELDQSLGEKLIELKGLDEQRVALERAIESARTALESDLRACDATIDSLERILDAGDAAALEELRGRIAALRLRETERASFQTRLESYREDRGQRAAENNALKAEMNKLKDRQDRLKALNEAVCPLCGQPLTPEHRDSMIEEIAREGKLMGDQHRDNATHVKALETVIAEHQAAITEIALALQPLPDLQAELGKLEERLESAQAAAAQLEPERARRDGLRAQLEAGDYAHAERETLAALNAAREELGYDDASHQGARKSLKAYNDYEVRYHQLKQADDSLANAQVDLGEAEAELKEQRALYDECQTTVNTLDKEIAALRALSDEAKRRHQELILRQQEEARARENVGAARQDLAAIEIGRTRKVELAERIAGHREQRALYDDLRIAFSKNGIPAMIIDAALPELEDEANRLLTRMTDGQMHIAISTQREKVTGGVAETLDIQIADGLGTRQYEMYSGGEAFRINFALRIALSQMLARRAGARLRTLFIDEGFGTQDEAGRAKLVEAITAIQDDFDLILVITHIDDLRDAFPVHILVEKTGEGSRIALR